MAAPLTAFREWLAARGLGPATVELYARAVAQAQARGADLLAPLQDEGLGAQRRETFRKAVVRWAQFQADAELEQRARAARPSRRALAPRVQPAIALRSEWPRLLAALGSRPWPARGGLLLLALTGLRIAEVMDLAAAQLAELGRVGRTVTEQKGGGLRRVTVPAELRPVCEYLARELEPGAALWHLYLTPTRRQRKGVEEWLRREVASAGEEAGVEARVHPHMLRRAAADAVLDETGDMKLVQEMLGHKSIQTTQAHYQIHGHAEQLAAAQDRALARARREKP